ncbi:MAG: PqqD family protein [Betaproteobacteria bacterium]|nr:PqqD family protein [Betaproteobacteria bacterium]
MFVQPASDGSPSALKSSKVLSNTRYAKRGEFVTRNIAGETIIVPVRGRVGDLDSIYNLSEVASAIWNRIDGQTNFQQIVESVCAEFDVPPETAESDALQFIAELQNAALIEPMLETKA